MLFVLTDACGVAVLSPIPVPVVVAPSPPLARQHVPGVAVEFDHGAGGEGEGGLAAVGGGGQGAARDHWKKHKLALLQGKQGGDATPLYKSHLESFA